MMRNKYTYSPAEVCEMFGISKSTLLRWERERTVSPAKREPHTDQRIYTQDNLREIGQQLKRQITTHFKRTVETDNEDEAVKAYEKLYIWGFIQGEPNALEALENYPALSADSIRKLWRIGLERYDPSSPMFHRIAKIVAKQSGRLSGQIKSAR